MATHPLTRDTVIVQVLDSLGEGRGGLTRAVYDRFRHLSEGRRAILITVAYQTDGRAVFERLQAQGLLPQHAELVNFHDSMYSNRAYGMGRRAPSLSKGLIKDATEHTVERFAKKSLKRYFSHGVFRGVEAHTNEGRWISTQVHAADRPWVLTAEEFASPQGTPRLRNYYDENQAVRYRVYYTEKGAPYLHSWVTPGGYEYRAVAAVDSGKPAVYKDVKAVNSAWLESQLAELGNVWLFADEPRTNFAFTKSAGNVSRIANIHADHRSGHHPAELKHWTRDYVSARRNIDRFVFPTQAQADVFVADTDVPPEQVLTIPHAAAAGAPEVGDGAQAAAEGRFVFVGRLAPEKRIDHIIRALALVREEVPGATLSIFGEGPSAEQLRELVGDMSLDEAVTFGGRTAEPVREFSRATASVVTSTSEGFGLVILESFLGGTPVIAYDVPYGPRELISTDSNGVLVPDGDIDALAVAMLKLLRSERAGELRASALETAAQHSQEAWRSNWECVVV